MKKIVLTLAALLVLNVGIGLAAPINDLSTGQTALGLGSDAIYLEHKLTNNFTLGVQEVDRDGSHMDDIYGQFHLTGNLRGIIGSRDWNPDSKLYLGIAANGSISSDTDGYASLIAGSEFKELQLGANFKLTHNVDLNLSYHSFMPDVGNNKNGVGIGATLKF